MDSLAIVGHLFQDYDAMGFLPRILVKIPHVQAFIPRIRPFSTHVCLQNSRIYEAFNSPYIQRLKCAFTRLRNHRRDVEKIPVGLA